MLLLSHKLLLCIVFLSLLHDCADSLTLLHTISFFGLRDIGSLDDRATPRSTVQLDLGSELGCFMDSGLINLLNLLLFLLGFETDGLAQVVNYSVVV